jgi:hypothetical protein
MTTYQDVAREVKASAGFVPKTCWIAHVLELLGVKLRHASNRISPAEKNYPCPPEKMNAIIAALYKLGRVRPVVRDAL